MTRFKVLRQHLGDREYLPGDTREADPLVVAHLVAAGVLEEVKIEPPVEKKTRKK
jgi:hypothetical protein